VSRADVDEHLLDRPHHDGSPLHLPEPHPDLGDTVPALVRVPDAAGVSAVHVRTVRDGEPRFAAAVVDRREVGTTWWRVDVRAANPTTSYRFLLDGAGGYRWLTAAGVVTHDPTDASDFRLVAGSAPPSWAADAVCYQIFPDRFARSADADGRTLPDWALPAGWGDEPLRDRGRALRQIYGGDLTGIVERLDHLLDLGVTAVYLTPVFPAPSNHRYDAAAFDAVDPLLGGDAALAELSAALHGHGLRLIGDLTLNHTGATHDWFRAARADPGSTEAGFYVFRDHPDDYLTWLNVPTLPKLDHRSAELRRRLYEGSGSVAARYLAAPFSLDGWRVDAANMAGRFADVDEGVALRRTLRATAREVRRDPLLIAEHCHDASADLGPHGWDGTMAYAGFTRPAWTWLGAEGPATASFLGVPAPVPRLPGSSVAATVDAFRAALPWQTAVTNLNLLGSHDTARFRTVAGSRERALVGAAWLLTAPGIPMVFAGDEVGLEGVDNEDARRPMPWDGRGWDADVHAVYRTLVALRREHVALRRGGFRWAHVGDDVLVFLREHPDERLLVHLAREAHAPVRLPLDALGAMAVDPLLGARPVREGDAALLRADGPAWGISRLLA
jgi:alpha-glucosidase